MIRKVIQEHVDDEHHEHGEGSHEHEPYEGYVEAMAAAHVDEQRGGLDFDEYAAFAAQYGYTDLDQLEEWWETAIAQSRGYSFRDGFGDGYAPAPHGERRNNSRFFYESKWAEYDAKIKRAKEYIVSDQSLYYSLRQKGHPFSVAHYSLEPIRTKEQIMTMLDSDQYLEGYKVVGEVSNTIPGYVTYLLRDVTTYDYDYGVLLVEHSTNSGLMASGFGSDFEILRNIIEYVHSHRGSYSRNNPELDQYINQV